MAERGTYVHEAAKFKKFFGRRRGTETRRAGDCEGTRYL
ncbi:hypothetical protein [Sphingomonas sp. CFBP9021]